MSSASTEAFANRSGIRNTLAEIAVGYGQFEQFLAGLFDELDALSADLVQRHNAWLEERRSAGQQSEALREQIRRWQERQADWERERTSLEHELEAVRCRAGELSESMAQQQRQVEDRQAQWTAELREMRRLLEMMAKRQFQGPEDGERRPPCEPGAAPPAPTEAPADPVLDSVMAQFEMLQRDLARRKRNPSAIGQ